MPPKKQKGVTKSTDKVPTEVTASPEIEKTEDNKPDKIKQKILAILAETEHLAKLEKEYDDLLYTHATKNGRNQNILVDDVIVKYKETFNVDLDPRVVKVLRKYDRFRFYKKGGPALYELEGFVEIEPKYHIYMGTIMQHAISLQQLTRILPPIDATEEQLQKFENQYISVLDIGCGSGYLTACMCDMIGLSWKHRVVALDLHNSLSSMTLKNICSFSGLKRAYDRGILKFAYGDGMLGFDYRAPYNFITYGFRCEGIPVCVAEQLSINGYIIAPVKDEYTMVHKSIAPYPERPSSVKIMLDTHVFGTVPSYVQSGATEDLVEEVLPYSTFQRPVDEEYMLTDYEIAMISLEATERAEKIKKQEAKDAADKQYEEEGYRKTTLEEIQALAGINLEEMVMQSLVAAGITLDSINGGGYKVDLDDPRIKTITSHSVDEHGNPVTNTTNNICFGTSRPPPPMEHTPHPSLPQSNAGKLKRAKAIRERRDGIPNPEPVSIGPGDVKTGKNKATPAELHTLAKILDPKSMKMSSDKLLEAAAAVVQNKNKTRAKSASASNTTVQPKIAAEPVKPKRGKSAAVKPIKEDEPVKPKRGRPKKQLT